MNTKPQSAVPPSPPAPVLGIPGIGFLLGATWTRLRSRLWLLVGIEAALLGASILALIIFLVIPSVIILWAGGTSPQCAGLSGESFTKCLGDFVPPWAILCAILLLVVPLMALQFIAIGARMYAIARETPPTFREAVRWGVRRFFPLLGVGFIGMGVVGLPLLLVFLLVLGAARAAGSVPPVLLLLVPLLPLSLVAVIYLSVRLLLTNILVALAETGVVEAFSESWRLTKGRFWAIFGRYFVVALLSGVVSAAVSGIEKIPFLFTSTLVRPASAGSAAMTAVIALTGGVVQYGVSLVMGLFVATFLVVLFRWVQRVAGPRPVKGT